MRGGFETSMGELKRCVVYAATAGVLDNQSSPFPEDFTTVGQVQQKRKI